MGNTHQKVDRTVNGFRKNDSETMRATYQEVYPKVRAHILKNNGSEDQAKDIFQEAFVACWRNIKDGKFMGIHYDYKSKRGERAMLKEAKRKARIIQRRAKRMSSSGTEGKEEIKTHDIKKIITLEDLTNPNQK